MGHKRNLSELSLITIMGSNKNQSIDIEIDVTVKQGIPVIVTLAAEHSNRSTLKF